MGQQHTFADAVHATKRRTTRRAHFLTEMDQVIPWATLGGIVVPRYPTAGRGRHPLPLGTMLRIYFLQQWFNLSDPQAEDMLHDSEAMRRFARIDPLQDTVPDETTICKFRHLLERHALKAQMFDAVKPLLAERKPLLKAGTIVDATITGAPSFTKKLPQSRDPEMRQTRKGNQWYFGIKVHIGTDCRGVIHSMTTTDAATAHITQLPNLLNGAETTLYGDKADFKAEEQPQWKLSGGRYRVRKKGKRTPGIDAINRSRARVRAMMEHPFQVMKRVWDFTKVRYRGLAKITVRAFALGALTTLYRLRCQLAIAGT